MQQACTQLTLAYTTADYYSTERAQVILLDAHRLTQPSLPLKQSLQTFTQFPVHTENRR